jgi:hypothetical protein
VNAAEDNGAHEANGGGHSNQRWFPSRISLRIGPSSINLGVSSYVYTTTNCICLGPTSRANDSTITRCMPTPPALVLISPITTQCDSPTCLAGLVLDLDAGFLVWHRSCAQPSSQVPSSTMTNSSVDTCLRTCILVGIDKTKVYTDDTIHYGCIAIVVDEPWNIN